MFQKVFEYAGPHKKGLYAATAVVLVSSFCFYFRLLFVVKELNVGNYMLSYEQIIQEVN